MERGVPIEILKVGNGYLIREAGVPRDGSTSEVLVEALVFSFLGGDDMDSELAYVEAPNVVDFLKAHFSDDSDKEAGHGG